MGADVIAVVKDGGFVEVGNHESLLEKNGFYAKLVQRQIKRKAIELPSTIGDGGEAKGEENSKNKKADVESTIDALLGAADDDWLTFL